MATNIVQMTDGAGNKQYPVTSAEAVGMPDGSGNLQNYLDKRVTDLNISELYPTQGIGGTNKYDLAGAIAQVDSKYRNIQGLKITFINNATGKTETWKYDGGTFTSIVSWIQGDGSGGNLILVWNTDVATTRKQVPLKERKKLLQISYENAEGDIVNEQYIGTQFTDEKWQADYNWVRIESDTNTNNINKEYQSKIIGYTANTTKAIISNRQFVSNETDNGGRKKITLQYPIETGYFKIGLFGSLKSHLVYGNLYGVTEDNESILIYGQLQSQNLLDALNTFISVRATKKIVALSLTTNGVIDTVGADIVVVQSEEPITDTIKKNYNSIEQQLVVKEKTYTTDNLLFTLGSYITKDGTLKQSNAFGLSEEIILNKGDFVNIHFTIYSLDENGISLLSKKEEDGSYTPIIICTQNGPEQTITGSVLESGIYVLCKHYYQSLYTVTVTNSDRFKELVSNYVSVNGLKNINRWDILGDSFSQYPNNGTYVAQENCWYRLIAARNNIPFNDSEQVHAQGGRTLAYHETADRNTIVERLDEIPEDTELITIMAGANDCYVYNIDIGEFEPSSIPSTPQECITFYKGLVYTFNTLLNKCPRANIIYIIEPRNKNSNPYVFDDYIKAIKTACAHYSIPYINLAEECVQLQPYIESKQKIYYVWASDGSTLDGVHPGTEGHRVMSYFIESKMSPYLNHFVPS